MGIEAAALGAEASGAGSALAVAGLAVTVGAALGAGGATFLGSSHASKRTVRPTQPSIRAMVLRLARSLGRPGAAKRPRGRKTMGFLRLAAPFALCTILSQGAVEPAARAEVSPSLVVVAQCDHASEPGRVRCGIELKPPSGERLVWADVVVVKVPSFTAPLRGRVGPLEATAKDPAGYRFALALVARATGRGELALRVRAVVCSDKGGCRTVLAEPTTEVVVGG